MAPFGVPQIVALVEGAGSVLDAGCGSARLTLAIAEAGVAEVVGVDTSNARLDQGRARLAEHPAGEHVELLRYDFNEPLPFDDGRFGATVSRLALMIAADPVATLRELGRVTSPGGRIVTELWAPIEQNPWFGLPRAAAASVLGADRADYARAFGRLGELDEAADVHREAGLDAVEVTTLRETLDVEAPAAWWAWLARENGHVRRLDASLTDAERAAVLEHLDGHAREHRTADGTLALPRTLTLVSATV